MTQHRQVRLTATDGRTADVDELIAPIIAALWQSGVRTQGSCQEQDGTTWPGDRRGAAWIAFASRREAEAFSRIAGNGARLMEITDEDRDGPDDGEHEPYTPGTAAAAFPTSRIEDVARRIRAAATVRKRH